MGHKTVRAYERGNAVKEIVKGFLPAAVRRAQTVNSHAHRVEIHHRRTDEGIKGVGHPSIAVKTRQAYCTGAGRILIRCLKIYCNIFQASLLISGKQGLIHFSADSDMILFIA